MKIPTAIGAASLVGTIALTGLAAAPAVAATPVNAVPATGISQNRTQAQTQGLDGLTALREANRYLDLKGPLSTTEQIVRKVMGPQAPPADIHAAVVKTSGIRAASPGGVNTANPAWVAWYGVAWRNKNGGDVGMSALEFTFQNNQLVGVQSFRGFDGRFLQPFPVIGSNAAAATVAEYRQAHGLDPQAPITYLELSQGWSATAAPSWRFGIQGTEYQVDALTGQLTAA